MFRACVFELPKQLKMRKYVGLIFAAMQHAADNRLREGKKTVTVAGYSSSSFEKEATE
jgi:hypothetical protein